MASQISPEQRTDARANHARIVRAATALFAERGLGVEMREIAEAAGVAVGTIYRHFPGKEDLLTAIARTMLSEAAEAVRSCSEEADPIEGIAGLLAVNLAGVARFGWLTGVLHSGQIPRHHLEALKSEMESSGLRRRYLPLLSRAVECGRLRPDLDIAIASAMLEGATAPWTSASMLVDRTPEAAAAAILQTFLQGAAATQTEPAEPAARPGARGSTATPARSAKD
jgi:AcrR family transcriptional regulator